MEEHAPDNGMTKLSEWWWHPTVSPDQTGEFFSTRSPDVSSEHMPPSNKRRKCSDGRVRRKPSLLRKMKRWPVFLFQKISCSTTSVQNHTQKHFFRFVSMLIFSTRYPQKYKISLKQATKMLRRQILKEAITLTENKQWPVFTFFCCLRKQFPKSLCTKYFQTDSNTFLKSASMQGTFSRQNVWLWQMASLILIKWQVS